MAAGTVTFLRPPPFPWLATPVRLDGGRHADDVPDLNVVKPALRAARVGGRFWGRPVVAPAGSATSDDTHDPWSQAEQADEVRAERDEPLALVAQILGRRVVSRSGNPIDPGDLNDALRAALSGRRWRDPFTGEPSTLLATIALLGDWRAILDANRRIGAAAGMAGWKRQAVARFLWDGERSPSFGEPEAAMATAREVGRAVACWPSRVGDDVVARAASAGVAIAWVEDGFLRSNGLGADCRTPSSIAVDHRGVYYDPAAPSDLETLLAEHPFPPALLDRARRLRARIVASRVGKYGVSHGMRIALPADRRVVLAIGQVTDDLSVVRAGGDIADNAGFLERVRACEPDAFILYRPHPDVVAGHRRGHVGDADALRWVDRVEAAGDLLALVERADAVHVLSSLTGFEALLRERPVVVHGRPFYAGWGLTRDLAVQPVRRGRRLDLDALVAGALILYPRYLDPVTQLPCAPELLVERIAAGAAADDGWLVALRRVQGRIRRRVTIVRQAAREAMR